MILKTFPGIDGDAAANQYILRAIAWLIERYDVPNPYGIECWDSFSRLVYTEEHVLASTIETLADDERIIRAHWGQWKEYTHFIVCVASTNPDIKTKVKYVAGIKLVDEYEELQLKLVIS